ncbi:MAG: hypothetical protein FJ317_04125, partial [SAR202 cluster bacterium]|nr:hypothetical protein [SAR202 cluster bacterium]
NFGSAKLDLRDAVIVEKPAVLEVRASFGEVEIVLPREWSVEFDIAANLAGVTDGRTGPTAEGPPDLVLTGSVLLGNIAVYD